MHYLIPAFNGFLKFALFQPYLNMTLRLEAMTFKECRSPMSDIASHRGMNAGLL